MALSGSSRVAATTQNNLVFSWAAAQDTAKNQSTVTWSLQLTAGTYGRISATPGSPWTVDIDGQAFSGTTSIAIGNGETKVLASGTAVLAHDELGEKSFNFTFTQAFHITFGGQNIGVVSGSGSAVLDTIPRASQISASAETVTLGSPVTFYTNPAGDFTHALEYSFGTVSGVVAQGVGESVEWTPDLELARQIPNAVTGTATVRCHTYDGATYLGTRELALSLAVPESVVPTAEAVFTDTSGATDLMGTPVLNVSKFAVTVEGTGAYGSTIIGAAVELDGKPYRGSVITDLLKKRFQITVTDSRGRVGNQYHLVVLAPYQMPSLTLNASRCLEDGTHDDTGEFAHITVSGSVSDVAGKNSGILTLQWGWESEEITVEAGEFALERIVPASSNYTLEISATLADKLLSTADQMTLSTGYATLDLLSGGRGLALGKSATREGFDCAMPAYFTGGLNGLSAAALGQQVSVTGPVLAAVSGGSAWGLYLVWVLQGAVAEATRLAGELDVEFSMEDAALQVSGYGITGWCIGCA